MHLLLSPGSPPSSLWVARTCPSATVRKAHASPAVGNLPEPSEVGVICLLSLPDTQTRAQTHRHTRPPRPGAPPWWGPAQGGPAPRPCHPAAPPGRAASAGGFSKRRNTSRCFRTAGNEGAEIDFMVSNRYQDYTGIPTRTTRCSQQVQRNRKINGESTTRNRRAGVG